MHLTAPRGELNTTMSHSCSPGSPLAPGAGGSERRDESSEGITAWVSALFSALTPQGFDAFSRERHRLDFSYFRLDELDEPPRRCLQRFRQLPFLTHSSILRLIRAAHPQS